MPEIHIMGMRDVGNLTCDGCIYWRSLSRTEQRMMHGCHYLLHTGKMRPSGSPAPGLRCELYQ